MQRTRQHGWRGKVLGVALLLPLLCPALALPAYTGPPLQQYMQASMDNFILCRIAAAVDLLRVDSVEKTRTCLSKAKTGIVPFYTAAKEALTPHPSALALLKDYYAAWLGALDALFPGIGESDRAYHARIEALENRLKELGHRLTIEAQ